MDRLRILAVRAEPPEITPLGESRLTVLAHDPQGRPLGHLFLACDPVVDPDPGTPTYSACESEAVVAEPQRLEALLEEGGARLLPGDPTGPTALWAPPTGPDGRPRDLFAGLAPDDPRRVTGASVDLLVVVGPLAGLEALAAGEAAAEDLDLAVALKRFVLSESDTPNTNPQVMTLAAAQTAFSATAPLGVPPGRVVSLSVQMGADSFQPFTEILPDGTRREDEEEGVVSWLSTAGTFEEARTGAVEANRFRPPEAGRVRLWAVVRDGRGGTGWAEGDLEVVPEAGDPEG